MVISIIYLILSLILDGFMSNIFSSTLNEISLFTTIYCVISFVIIYPYFDNNKKYYILLGIFGILFDILYTGTFIFNMVIFLIIGIIIKVLYNIFPENIFNTNVIGIICVGFYHIISYVILELVSGVSYDFMLLIYIIIHSILMTIIYSSISYFMMKFIYNKYNIKYIK